MPWGRGPEGSLCLWKALCVDSQPHIENGSVAGAMCLCITPGREGVRLVGSFSPPRPPGF